MYVGCNIWPSIHAYADVITVINKRYRQIVNDLMTLLIEEFNKIKHIQTQVKVMCYKIMIIMKKIKVK